MSANQKIVGNFILEGHLDSAQVQSYLRDGNVKSWLLLEPEGGANCPASAVKSAGLDFACVPFVKEEFGFPTESAGSLISALDALPRPTVVSCATARRASAVLALYLAHRQSDASCEIARESPALSLARALDLKASLDANLASWLDLCSKEMKRSDLIFRQLFDTSGSSTYTYLLGDPVSKDAILIDPVLEMVERDLDVADDLALKLKYVLNTHCHADHITGTGAIKKLRPEVKSMISKASGANADIYLLPGEKVYFGERYVEVRATPGHTDGCVTFVSLDNGGMAFTGDALLIRGCGRTDFQQGSSETLFDSVHSQIFSLPETFQVYPAHDYKGRHHSTILEEKTLNPRLTKTKEEFKSIMDNLGLPYPKKIDAAVPANMVCGIQD